MSISHSALRAFHVVATEVSFTKVARKLNVTQPTLSGQVKALEEQFGVRLFHRRKRKIKLPDLTGHRLILRESTSTTRRTFDAKIAKSNIKMGEILEIGNRNAKQLQLDLVLVSLHDQNLEMICD